jgi:hypothetical protein
MSKWTKRVGFAAVIAAGALSLSVASSLAVAPAPSASVNGETTSAAALGVPGTLTVSEASATRGTAPSDASWSAVAVQGTPVVGKDKNDEWVGTAAGLGATADSLNAALCPNEPIELAPATSVQVCAIVLAANTNTDFGSSNAVGDVAAAEVVVKNDGTTYGAIVEALKSSSDNYGCPGRGSHGTLLEGYTFDGTGGQYFDIGGETAAVGDTCS